MSAYETHIKNSDITCLWRTNDAFSLKTLNLTLHIHKQMETQTLNIGATQDMTHLRLFLSKEHLNMV